MKLSLFYPTVLLVLATVQVHAGWHHTGCNDHGRLEFLDRHALDCGHGRAMTNWKIRRCGHHNRFKIHYYCRRIPQISSTSPRTSCQTAERHNIEFLDRFDVRCSSNQVMQRWHFNSHTYCPGDTANIVYRCATVPGRLSCFERTTGCNEIYGKEIIYLDRHNIQCPGRSMLQRWKMDPSGCGGGNSRFRYTCCNHSTLRPTPYPTPRPTPYPTPRPSPSPTNKPSPGPTPGPTNKPSPGPTNTPTKSPTKAPGVSKKAISPGRKPEKTIGVEGDPHFHSFTGRSFDFMGGCDLVLLQNKNFGNGKGISVHIRTKIQSWYSYIESAVVKIGDDTFEVKSGFEERQYWVNGVAGAYEDVHQSGPLPFTIGGYPLRFRVPKDNVFQFKIFLDDEQALLIRSVKKWLRVDIQHAKEDSFTGSTGLMGDFGSENMIGRDGVTVFNDRPDDFGMEWQVRSDEPQLFHIVEGVQHPEICAMPDKELTERRNLRLSQEEGGISRSAAKDACANAESDQLENCIEDVIAAGDVEYALEYGAV